MKKFREVLGDAKVFYRIYPSENPDWKNFRLLTDEKTILLHHVGPKIKEGAGEGIFKQFETDGFFYNRHQEHIHSIVMNGVIESVFEGQNAIIAAFGQTGSGKSLTINGLHCFYQDRGLVPRIIENIFIMKEKLPKNLEMTIHISYIEILSSFQSRDLLRPYPAPVDKNNVHKFVCKLEVRSELQTLQHIFMAEGRKEYTPDTNHPSHTGSSVLTFEFTIRNMNFSEPYEFKSKLHVIDLAGNDSFGDKSSTYKNYLQVGSANCTKSFMEHFILLSCSNDPELARVKKRTNILLQYLGDTFNRSSLLRFIGHLKTSKEDHDISISLLKFGQIFTSMKPEFGTIILKENDLMKIALLEEQLANLHKENMITQMLQNQEPKGLCPERFAHIKRMIEDFVHNRIEGSHLLKLGDIYTILKIMKENIMIYEENMMLFKGESLDKTESKLDRLETRSSIHQPSIKVRSKQSSKTSDLGITPSNISQQTSVKDSTKGLMKKSSSHTKSKKDSSEDKVAINRKGKISTSSLNGIKRSSTVGKKKGGGYADSVGSTEKTSKKGVGEYQQNSSLLSAANLILPEVIPEHMEVLKEYVLSPKTAYKTLLDTFKKYENEAKNVYQSYLKELKKLDSYFEILDLRKNEVVQTKLVAQFSRKRERDAEGNVIKSELEERCHENLKKAEADVSTQQEVVLNLQAEFKIALSMRQQIKNDVKEEFDEFCKEKYSASVPNLDELNDFVVENEVSVDQFCEHAEIENVSEELTQENVYEEIYKNLKKLMTLEARKKALYAKKTIKWLENTRSTCI